MSYGLLDLVGNIGVVILMVAYLMLQLNKLRSDDLAYSLLNAIGASLIVLSLIVNFNLSAMVMEVFWVLISFVGIFRYVRLKSVRS
jgi:multidrug transporter EmrE-like cation transporter